MTPPLDAPPMDDPACRIYVDHTHLRGHVTGIERVAIDLFRPETLQPHPVTLIRSTGLAGMIAAQQLGFPIRMLRDRSALFIFPGFPPSPFVALHRQRCITYVHDTFLLTRPEDLSWKSRLYMAPSFAFALRFGRTFLVNSRTTGEAVRAVCSRRALVALLRPPVHDVFGLSDLFARPPYEAGSPIRILAIGTIEPRKDYPAAIAITAALNASGIPAELHVVGRVGWGDHAFLGARPPFLTLHGYCDDAEVRRVAAQCHLLLSTSKAEGLGLPLLEVQHGGLPIAAPSGPVFSEVLGRSGLLIDTTQPEKAASAILSWISSKDFAAVPSISRANVASWNGLAAQDAVHFSAFLKQGATAYQNARDALIQHGRKGLT